MKNTQVPSKNGLYTLATLLDVIGPEASLGRDAWAEISILDLMSEKGIRTLLKKYVLPEYFKSPEIFQTQYLKCLQDLLSAEHEELEKFPMSEYPYLENTPPKMFFSTLLQEINLAIEGVSK